MPVANQYGIDMGNILSQSSNIKTARLNREKNQLAVDKTKAGIKLRENYLNKKSNALAGKDETPIETLPQAEVNKLSAQAPKVSMGIQAEQQKTQQHQALVKYFENKGLSTEEADIRASGYGKEINTFSKAMRESNDEQKQVIKDNISKQAQSIQSVLETAKDNPQLANKMFLDYRANAEEQIKEQLKNGNREGADIIQAELDKIPKSLIQPDGSFNAEFLMLKLSQYNSMLTTEESYQKEQQQSIEQENKLALEKVKQEDKIKQIKEKSKYPPVGTEKEHQKIMRLLKNPNLSKQDRKDLEARKLVLEQTKLGSKAINEKFYDDKIHTLRKSLPIKYIDADLSSIDMRNVKSKERAILGRISDKIIARDNPMGAKDAIKDTRKSLVVVNQLAESIRITSDIMESGKNINFVDKTVRDNLSQYLGLSDNELQTAFRDKRFASAANSVKHALFGSAQSKQEMKSFLDSTASLMSTNKNLVLGMKSMLEDVKAKLSVNADIIPIESFNIKFGAKMRNIDSLISSIDEVLSGENKKDEESEQDKISRLRHKKQSQKKVAEERKLQDGRIVVKYTDGTYGVK